MKMKLSTFLVLLVCALAATTSLTPIVAKASGALQGGDRECRERLAAIGRAIRDYRAEHGRLPDSLEVLNVPVVCPESGEEYFYRAWTLPEEALRNYWTQEQIDGYRRLLESVDWQRNVVVGCGWHYDPATIEAVHYTEDGFRWLEGRFDGPPAAFLGANLNGQVTYAPYYDDVARQLEAYKQRNPYRR